MPNDVWVGSTTVREICNHLREAESELLTAVEETLPESIGVSSADGLREVIKIWSIVQYEIRESEYFRKVPIVVLENIQTATEEIMKLLPSQRRKYNKLALNTVESLIERLECSE